MNNLLPKIGLLLLITFTALPIVTYSQSPQQVSYQAIIRGKDATPIANTPVVIVLTVRKTSVTGPDVYTETHNVTTDPFGAVSLNLGAGTTSGKFSNIDWSAGPYFLKVAVDGKEMGITQIVSIPYSLYALNAGNGLSGTAPNYYMENAKVGIGTKTPLSTLSVTGSNVSDSAIFEVKNNNGLTVFAVYNEGVRISIDENMKSAKGGFAIGGFSGVKGKTQEYFRVTSDSTRMYLNNATMTKGAKGGFAIGGFDLGKAPILNFVSLTQTNSLLGYSAGDNITTGTKNFFAGYEAGELNATGSENIFIGDMSGFNNNSNTNIFIGTEAGYSNKTAFGSIIIGDKAGYFNNGSRNIFLGREAGYSNTTGMDNVYLGSFSGQKITTGTYNTFIGVESGNFSTDGWDNVYVGHRAGYVSNGTDNVIIGDAAGSNDENYLKTPSTFNNSVIIGASSGLFQQSGTANTYLGAYAGMSNLTGTGNVFLGNQAGQNESGSNKLYINNNLSDTPLIYGEFSNDAAVIPKVRINGKLEISTVPVGSSSAYLFVDGSGVVTKLSSSRKYKDEINPLHADIEKFMSLQPVSFRWNSLTVSEGVEDLGLIAEDVNKTMPSLSIYNPDGTIEGVNYHAVNVLTVSVVQQQQKKISEMESELACSKKEILLLREKINSDELLMQKILDELSDLKQHTDKTGK